MTDGSSAAALTYAAALHRDLGLMFPSALHVRGDDVTLVLVMRDGFLDERTTGPYSEQNPPIEALKFIDLYSAVGLAGHLPRFTLGTDPSRRWARVGVELTGTRIRARIVMPEEVPAASLDAPKLGAWQGTMATHVRVTLGDLADLLWHCAEGGGAPGPQVDLRLRYLADPDHESSLAAVPETFRDALIQQTPPVRGLLTLRWLRATPEQQRRFQDLLRSHRSVAEDGVRVTRRWLRRRITVPFTYGLSRIDVRAPYC